MDTPQTGSVQENLGSLYGLIRRMRQKEAVGSLEDELVLSRVAMDMTELLALVATFGGVRQQANAEADGPQGV